MSYTKRPDVILQGGRAAFQLDDGHLIALRIETLRDPVTNRATYKALASALNDDLTAKCDEHGQPIEVAHTFSPTPEVLAQLGDDGVGREMALVALGEPASASSPIDWSEEFRSSASIRNALAVAGMTGTFDNLLSIL